VSKSEYFYQHIAAKTFGYYLPLSNFDEVKKVLMNICFREAGLESVGIISMIFSTKVGECVFFRG
jgi:hypothetical protein